MPDDETQYEPPKVKQIAINSADLYGKRKFGLTPPLSDLDKNEVDIPLPEPLKSIGGMQDE